MSDFLQVFPRAAEFFRAPSSELRVTIVGLQPLVADLGNGSAFI